LILRLVEQEKNKPLKIVYAGIRGSGKCTNLKAILESVEKPGIIGLANVIDHSLGNSLMDYLLFDITPKYSTTIRVFLITLSPTLHRELSRDIILSGIDGVVMVIDSNVGLFHTNMKAYREISETLSVVNTREKIEAPVIIQYNKRDIKNRLPVPYLQSRLNPRELPSVSSVANQGKGVLSTFRTVLSAAMETRESRIRNLIGHHS